MTRTGCHLYFRGTQSGQHKLANNMPITPNGSRGNFSCSKEGKGITKESLMSREARLGITHPAYLYRGELAASFPLSLKLQEGLSFLQLSLRDR